MDQRAGLAQVPGRTTGAGWPKALDVCKRLLHLHGPWGCMHMDFWISLEWCRWGHGASLKVQCEECDGRTRMGFKLAPRTRVGHVHAWWRR